MSLIPSSADPAVVEDGASLESSAEAPEPVKPYQGDSQVDQNRDQTRTGSWTVQLDCTNTTGGH